MPAEGHRRMERRAAGLLGGRGIAGTVALGLIPPQFKLGVGCVGHESTLAAESVTNRGAWHWGGISDFFFFCWGVEGWWGEGVLAAGRKKKKDREKENSQAQGG